jgi:hypothetical protein
MKSMGTLLLIALTLGGTAGPGMDVVFEHEGEPVYSVLPPGRIPAIDEPQFVQGAAADEQMAPQEPVFGLIVGDEVRAYSLWQLDEHEIVNDRIGGVAIAATW